MPENQPPSAPPPTIQPPPSATPLPPPNPESQARMWCMLCHLSSLAGYVGVPFGNIIGPLIVWQIKKTEFPSVDVHGKASLNFQLTVTIAVAIAFASAFALSFLCIGWLLFPLVFLIGIAGLVFAIIAGIKANNGEDYKYPWSLELIK